MAGSDDYERGHNAGGIAERLASHDRHFEAINGSMADTVRALEALTLAVQRLSDQAISRDATVVTTAKALKEAEEARRDKTNQSWSPLARISAVAATIATLIGLFYLLQGK